jgi:hypothetical protein
MDPPARERQRPGAELEVPLAERTVVSHLPGSAPRSGSAPPPRAACPADPPHPALDGKRRRRSTPRRSTRAAGQNPRAMGRKPHGQNTRKRKRNAVGQRAARGPRRAAKKRKNIPTTNVIAPCNKGVGDVGTGPNSRTEQNRSQNVL